jgi:hypothetical protein
MLTARVGSGRRGGDYVVKNPPTATLGATG